MEPTATKKRIEYIDLMKGVGIIIVIGHHCNIYTRIELLDNWCVNFFMPLFFFISGLFFKKHSCFKEFFVNKTNKILVPYFFFCWVPYCALSFFFTTNFTNPVYWLLAPIKMFNGVLWFLRSLFMSHIMYYFFLKQTERLSKTLQITILFIITILNYFVSVLYRDNPFLMKHDIFGLNFFTAVMILPYIYVAQIVMRHHLLQWDLSRKQSVLVFIMALACSFLFAQSNVSLNKALFGNIYIFVYISAICSIIALYILCRSIKRLPFVSYLGRYSLIVFGTHFSYINILRHLFSASNYVYFIIILALMPPTIWFFKKFFPYFTAQKDLLHYKSK